MTGSKAQAGSAAGLIPFDEALCPGVLGTRRAVAALHALRDDAMLYGFDLRPCSGYRSFERQAAIIDGKWCGRRPVLDENESPMDVSVMSPEKRLCEILRFSALPGFSRHHFGTDFDIYAPNLLPEGYKLELTACEYAPGSCFYELGLYLEANLSRFGFIRPFTGKGHCAAEPWHISFFPEAECLIAAFDLKTALAALDALDVPWSKTACEYAKAHFASLFS